MSSAAASGQRKALKALAKTPYDIFEDDHADIIAEKAVYKDVEKETHKAIKANDERDLSEDVSMDDQEGLQCGHCGEYHEDWIQCENKACTIQWYGLECAGLVEVPGGRWNCVMCRPRPIFPNLGGAPKVAKQDDAQQRPKGVASKKANPNKPKPGWKGWVEVTDEVKEKMQQEVDAQWNVVTLPKRTRTNTELYHRKQKRRLQRQKRRSNQSPQPKHYQDSQHPRISTPREEDSQSMDEDQSEPDLAVALADQGQPLSEPLTHAEDEDISDEEAEAIGDGISSQYDRESTFEGFSDPEKVDSIGHFPGDVGAVDEDEEAESFLSGDQSAEEVSDGDEDEDLEMADDIESGLDELSLVDGDEEAESLLSGGQSVDEASNIDDDHGVKPQAYGVGLLTEVDVGGETSGETLGVGRRTIRTSVSPGTVLISSDDPEICTWSATLLQVARRLPPYSTLAD